MPSASASSSARASPRFLIAVSMASRVSATRPAYRLGEFAQRLLVKFRHPSYGSDMRAHVGPVEKLQAEGRLVTKAGAHGVCVFWHEGCAYAVDDRCPHMGFPLHRGTVEQGLLTCHWHHARFDLATGGTLDPFADDVRAFPVEIADGDVYVVVEQPAGQVEHLLRRLADGLEQGLALVMAKAVMGLL